MCLSANLEPRNDGLWNFEASHSIEGSVDMVKWSQLKDPSKSLIDLDRAFRSFFRHNNYLNLRSNRNNQYFIAPSGSKMKGTGRSFQRSAEAPDTGIDRRFHGMLAIHHNLRPVSLLCFHSAWDTWNYGEGKCYCCIKYGNKAFSHNVNWTQI